MAKNKKPETGGLQQPKMTVTEREEVKAEKEKERKKDKKKKEKSDRPNIFRRIWRGIKGIAAELKKVEWPTFSQTVAKTGVVLGVVVVASLIIFGIDRGLGALYGLLTGNLD